MKVLLDECIDQRFRKELTGVDCISVQEAGWAGKKNGELLQLAATMCQVFITVDRNLHFQQNIPNLKIAVLVLTVRSNRLADLKPLAPLVLEELPKLRPGDLCLLPRKQS